MGSVNGDFELDPPGDISSRIAGVPCPKCGRPLEVIDATVRAFSGTRPPTTPTGVLLNCPEHRGWHWNEGATYLTPDQGVPMGIQPSPSATGRAAVYYYAIGDIRSGQNVRRGPATLEAIWKIRGRPLWESVHEVPVSELDGDGFTGRKGE